MNNVIEIFNQYLDQQIELYGDDLVAGESSFVYESGFESTTDLADGSSFIEKGSPDSKIWIVIDADNTEIADGFNLQSKAGNLFVKILKAIHVETDTIFLISVFNDENETEIKKAVKSQLDNLIESHKPVALMCFGNTAASLFFGSADVTSNREKVLDYKGVKVLTTHHPNILLQNQALKHETWKDVQELQKIQS